MTIRDLMKSIPEEHWDKMIRIYLPNNLPNDQEAPLIEMMVSTSAKGDIYVLLDSDYNK